MEEQKSCFLKGKFKKCFENVSKEMVNKNQMKNSNRHAFSPTAAFEFEFRRRRRRWHINIRTMG
jgi:hypothetical protein